MKVLLVDGKGTVLRSTSQSYPLMMPQPGWSEQDPEEWWSALCVCVPKLLDGIDATQVAGLSVGGQMHGLVALDENDNIIRPAILWNDGRTGKQTDAINSDFGKERLLALTGNLAFAGFTAPKLLWMRENEPELFAKIRRIMLPKDYIVYRLTGVHSCDYSDASGMLLLDVANRCWSKPLMDYCGVREEQLPQLFESYDRVGTVKPAMAALLGIPASTVVAAGAGDNAAAAVGTGTVGEGSCNISIGTSGTIFIPSREFKLPPEGNLHAFAHADGSWHLMGCILAAASAYTWWRGDVLKSDSNEEEQKDITREKLGKNHAYYLPYLMGERSPHNDPAARGVFAGMSLDTTRSDMTQAVMEGRREEPHLAADLRQRPQHGAVRPRIRGGRRLRRRHPGHGRCGRVRHRARSQRCHALRRHQVQARSRDRSPVRRALRHVPLRISRSEAHFPEHVRR